MSDYEHHQGKLIEVKPKEGQTPEELAAELVADKPFEGKENLYGDIFRYINDEYHKKYFCYKKKIYQIEDRKLDPYDDITEAQPQADGSINYQLRFYNGGTCMTECLEEALDKLQ